MPGILMTKTATSKFLVIKKHTVIAKTHTHQHISANKWTFNAGAAGNSSGAVVGGSAKYQINDHSSFTVSATHSGSYSGFTGPSSSSTVSGKYTISI